MSDHTGQPSQPSATPRSDRAHQCANQALRLIPQFSRWASAQVEGDAYGGDLSLRQLTVLYYIREQTPTLGYIAKQLMVTPAVVTGMVDRLERRGFVRRTADAGDRRVVRLFLTDRGRQISIDAEQALVRLVASGLAEHSEADLATLQQSLDLLSQILVDLERKAHAATATSTVSVGQSEGIAVATAS